MGWPKGSGCKLEVRNLLWKLCRIKLSMAMEISVWCDVNQAIIWVWSTREAWFLARLWLGCLPCNNLLQ